MNYKTLADAIIGMMLMHQKPSELWANNKLGFKELEEAKNVIQKNGQTVFEHTNMVLDCLTVKNHITLWSALFHDLGKINTRNIIDNNLVNFHGHESQSVIITQDVLSAWNEDPFIIDRTKRIVQTHMFDLSHLTQKAIRDFVGNVGKDNIDNWFIVREADINAYPHETEYVNKYIKPFKLKVEEYRSALLQEDTLDISPSNDVMQILGGK